MKDKLLVEVEMFNRQAQDGIRALVYLANELSESSTIHIGDPSQWHERKNDEYQLKWRFAEDALSSWEVVINADLVVQLTDALRTAQLALNEKGNRKEDTLGSALEAIEKVRSAFTESIAKAEPELHHFFLEQSLA
jgi:hypothetical protein